MQKIKFKDITFHGWIVISAIAIVVIIVLIFIFRKVDNPTLENVRELKDSINVLNKNIEAKDQLYRYNDSIRKRENDSLLISNSIIKDRIQTNTIYHERVIERLNGASASELEQFFTDRYKK